MQSKDLQILHRQLHIYKMRRKRRRRRRRRGRKRRKYSIDATVNEVSTQILFCIH